AAGCGFDKGAGSGGGGGIDDGGIADGGTADGATASDASSDAGPNCDELLPFEPSNFAACDLDYVPQDLVLDEFGGYLLDTDTRVLTHPGGSRQTLKGVTIGQTDAPTIFVIFYRSFNLSAGSALTIRGARAFALVTRDDLVVNGSMGVPASWVVSGAGGDNNAACVPGGRGHPGVLQSSGALSGGSGGGGGGFGAGGGRGAVVDGASGAVRTRAGLANGDVTLVPLRGGCRGGFGGDPASNGGPAGGAGGALQLVAGGTLQVVGYVTARGGGGQGVVGPSGGGGGGGSGGGLLLEATDLTIDGQLTANGGGGGEGGRAAGDSDFGSNGHDWDGAQASGGSLGSFGGDGGAGGALAGVDGEDGLVGTSDASDLAGGGGGGGSVGRIHLRAIGTLTIGDAALISPAAQ
ncbi:MAG TPA: hypothetical protein VL172_09930, partial [Kofleriaceae bacterium]|nr:hypothetical protein [Kofleriaceae bacterium]